MIPIITGVIASSYKVGSLEWAVELDVCPSPNTTTLYTAPSDIALLPGVVMYTDASLASIATNQTFVVGANLYITDGSGAIFVSQNKPTDNTFYDSCDPYSSPVTLWVTTQSVGGYVYTGCDLTPFAGTSFSNQSVYFDLLDGVIQSSTAC